MEFNISEDYHKILSHLIVAGAGTTESLAHSLVSTRILAVEDLHRVKAENSVKGKAEIVLKSVISEQHATTFKQCLEECDPELVKNILAYMPNESRNPLRSDEVEEVVDTGQLLQGLEVISCERDLLSEDFKAMSNKFDQVSEQLAQTQAESADLMRQNASDQQELAMLRRKSLIGGGGNSILNKMYETMLEKYEGLKLTHENLQKKLAEELQSRKELQQQMELYAVELSDARYKCSSIATDHEMLSRQFQSLNERNDGLQRDLHRVREERTLVKREYSLVMSERDHVHKEIQKLTDDISDVNRQLAESVAEKKLILDEKERLMAQLSLLKQSQGTQQATNVTSLNVLRDELFVAQRERKQALAQYEAQLHEAYMARKAQQLTEDNVIKLQSENESLAAKIESLTIELRDANSEAKDATRNRDMAFSEREKMRCERDEIKKTYDQLAEEREKIVKQLEAEMKEHDVTKEAKKRIMKELRELRVGSKGPITPASTGSRHDNTDSRDSAIDTDEWGSEEIFTLEGGGVSRRLRTFQCKLPRQPDINLETGLVVTRSACRGITIGDRVVSINETVVDSNNAPELQRLIPNSANPCVIKILRSSSPPPPNESLNGEFGPSSVDSALCTVRQNTITKGLATVDAECQTSQILPRRSSHRHSVENSIDDGTNEDTITPMVQRNINHAATPSACVSSGGESHQSTSTYSDSTHSTSQGIPRQPSNKSSDSSVSFHRTSSSRREKKKTKAKFWQRTKKSKSQAGTGRGGGGGGASHGKSSSGGTWPRLESPPLAPFGGRLSVFSKTKRSRPTISPTTFTPPMDSAGRTPPTVVRGISSTPHSADATPRLFQEIHPGSSPPPTSSQPLRPTLAMKKRPRPVSVPIDGGQPLVLWKEQQNISNSNNNNSQSPRRPMTPKSSHDIDMFLGSGIVTSESTSHDSSSESTNQSDRFKSNDQSGTDRLTVTTVQPTVTGEPITRPHTIFYEKPGFIRQQSVPPNTSSDKRAIIPSSFSPRQAFRHVQRSRPLTSPPAGHPRSVHSLPRPTSAKAPSSSCASSHQSIEASLKTKSLDYKRIRIPSEHSVGLKLGSDRGSSERSTPIFFHNNRSHSPATPLPSPATPLQSLYHSTTPLLHPSSSLLSSITGTSFSASMFHPSSTPLIPSPATPTVQPITPHILDSSVPIISGSTVSSLSNISSASIRGRRPPVTTDPRYVCMIKGTDPIGISIVGGGEKGGIFVSRITEDSLAARAGLEYGDQLLEYNGINLRCASEEQGRAIMSQTQPGDNITFLAQYNLEKYKSSIESNLSDSLGLMKVPKHRGAMLTPCDDNEGTITPDTTPRSSPHVDDTLRAQPIGQPRYVFVTNGCGHVTVVGGNNSGIFVASIGEGGHTEGDLKIGDQVLEFNSVDLRCSTLERASLMFAKPSVNTSLRVYYNSVGYSKMSTEPGDFFYVRALFDNIVEASTGNLPFSKNSILLVDNTYPDHSMGSWSAWLVDEHGEKTTHGKIPSKFTVERESGIQRDYDDAISCAGSTAGKKLGGTGRRSFFKRRKPHRTSSRSSGEVKLHKSVSETSIESTETNFEHTGAAYQVVEKHACDNRRPVVVFGPHSSAVCDRLTKEYSSSFARCQLDSLHSSSDVHDKNIIETFKQVGSSLALRVETLQREQQRHRHVLLEISQDAVDRLHSRKIYPIIVFIEYSSAKKVKESQDRVPGRDKISMKQSKDIFERANSIRKKLSTKYLGTVYIHGGSTATVAKQIHTVVDREQSKVLWLPTSHDLLNY